ncbi:hypothetical protein HK405_008114, partial [Cladochytrium tenue]
MGTQNSSAQSAIGVGVKTGIVNAAATTKGVLLASGRSKTTGGRSRSMVPAQLGARLGVGAKSTKAEAAPTSSEPDRAAPAIPGPNPFAGPPSAVHLSTTPALAKFEASQLLVAANRASAALSGGNRRQSGASLPVASQQLPSPAAADVQANPAVTSQATTQLPPLAPSSAPAPEAFNAVKPGHENAGAAIAQLQQLVQPLPSATAAPAAAPAYVP